MKKLPVVARFESENDFLSRQLNQDRPARLAVRVVLNLAQVQGNLVEKLTEAATAVGQTMQVAFKRHIANMADASQALATQLIYAEINRVSPAQQAELVKQGRDAPIVSEATLRQRRIAPEVQAALIEHCSGHTSTLQALAARPDATLDTLSALAISNDQRTRLNVAASLGGHMRLDEPGLATKKAAIFSALMVGYESDFAPYLVPVCQSSEQLREMFDKTSKALGVVEAFVENPYTPDSVLVDIASSPTMHLVQHGAAKRARDLLQARADLRESSSYSDDMAPS